MSESQHAPALPPFFSRVVGITPTQHGELRLDRSKGYGFAAHAQSVPLGLSELEAAAQHYPIVFTARPTPQPVALLGLQEAGNLFVAPDGTWQPNTYVPAYVRAFPFVFVEDARSHTTFLGVEATAACLSSESGQPLFEDGKPTPTLNEAAAFCQAYRDSLGAALNFGRALEAAGVLRDEEATVTFTAGGALKVRGFKRVKPELLAEVEDATFVEWRHMGWVAAIYAHLHSAGRWGHLVELSAARSAAAS